MSGSHVASSVRDAPPARLPWRSQAVAPDGVHVRQLLRTEGASAVHCSLPAFGTSAVTRNLAIEEIWYFLTGRGELALEDEEGWLVLPVYPGVCVPIPPDVAFQFRSVDGQVLTFLCVTMPPWPGDHASERLEQPGAWPVDR